MTIEELIERLKNIMSGRKPDINVNLLVEMKDGSQYSADMTDMAYSKQIHSVILMAEPYED